MTRRLLAALIFLVSLSLQGQEAASRFNSARATGVASVTILPRPEHVVLVAPGGSQDGREGVGQTAVLKDLKQRHQVISTRTQQVAVELHRGSFGLELTINNY